MAIVKSVKTEETVLKMECVMCLERIERQKVLSVLCGHDYQEVLFKGYEIKKNSLIFICSSFNIVLISNFHFNSINI